MIGNYNTANVPILKKITRLIIYLSKWKTAQAPQC